MNRAARVDDPVVKEILTHAKTQRKRIRIPVQIYVARLIDQLQLRI